jgi:hypothetical protein
VLQSFVTDYEKLVSAVAHGARARSQSVGPLGFKTYIKCLSRPAVGHHHHHACGRSRPAVGHAVLHCSKPRVAERAGIALPDDTIHSPKHMISRFHAEKKFSLIGRPANECCR